MSERDLFANFARMRREMDEMLSGTWGRATYISRRSSGFSPNVDVYYSGDPQRAVVKCDLAGIDLATVGIEVSGRLPHVLPPNPHNRFYLETKATRSGHYIDFAGKPHLDEQSDPVLVEGMGEPGERR